MAAAQAAISALRPFSGSAVEVHDKLRRSEEAAPAEADFAQAAVRADMRAEEPVDVVDDA